MILTAAAVLTPTRVHRPGWVQTEGERITGVGAGPSPGPVAHHLGPVLLAPGYVDIHCHGGGGHSFTTGDAAEALAAARHHHRSGTTSVMASLVTDTVDRMEQAVRALAPLVHSGDLLGIHLEGPWLSPRRAGAHQSALLRDPRPEDIDRLLDASEGTVRMVTVAPELDGGPAAVRRLAQRGVTVAVGHTDAGYAVTREALAAGATVGTHLFNAMRQLHHREPGPALALLQDPVVRVEVIADGIHLHPAVLGHVFATAPDRVALVTDAISAEGAPDGHYTLGPLQVEVRDGTARVPGTGAIAGSTLSLAQAVRFSVQHAGVQRQQAITAATATPATAVGTAEVGALAAGGRADLLALDQELAPVAVMRHGQWLRPPGDTDPPEGQESPCPPAP